MNSKNPTTDDSQILVEIAATLDEIRRLFIYALIRDGASQGQVAAALGTTQGTVSKLLSSSKKPSKRRK